MMPLEGYGEYDDGTDRLTDGQTPDRYVTLSAMDAVNVTRGIINCGLIRAVNVRPLWNERREADPRYRIRIIFRNVF